MIMLFHEIYSTYFQTVAKILAEAVEHPLTTGEINAIIQDYAFEESTLNIPESLGMTHWQLLKEDGTTILRKKPTMPLTILQKRWINAIALDPRIGLFTDQPVVFSDVEPLFLPEDIYVFDKYSDGDPYENPEYIRNFRLILDAIKHRYQIQISIINRHGKQITTRTIPEYLEYSEKDDKFRLIGTGSKLGNTINLGRIISCEKYENQQGGKVGKRNQPRQRKVIFELIDERNALERVLMHFAHLEKQVEKIDERKYQVTLYYDKEDETEILIRVLSFGPMGCVSAIREAFIAAKGGVLFIDEAYAMKSDTAITVLLQEMENQREDVIVILAGYNERMKTFMKRNEGLKSRIPYWIDFPDYTTEELTDIFKLMIREKDFCVTDDAIKEAHYIFEKVRNVDDFGNGRYVRNLMERAVRQQSVRLLSTSESASDIQKEELFQITKSDIQMLGEGEKKERESGTARKELDEMVGLASVKTVIHKAIAKHKINKLCMEKGLQRDKASLHMVFTGNPGTAKTTVARLFAEIMKDEKILSTGVFVEVGRADLVGEHVGATAPLVKKKFKEAQGGVLFIDEAYSLCDGYDNGFGDEAINTIVQEMENHRDNVIVIFAGYPEPMKAFLDRNPGMRSRIAFSVEFDDYTVEELCEITKLMLSRKQMTITEAGMKKLKKNFESVKDSRDYGNGRFARKMLEEAEMNLAERICQMGETEITTEVLTIIEESDIPDVPLEERRQIKKIGFAC